MRTTKNASLCVAHNLGLELISKVLCFFAIVNSIMNGKIPSVTLDLPKRILAQRVKFVGKIMKEPFSKLILI